MAQTSQEWTLVGADGTRYAALDRVTQKGNTWFAALRPTEAYARIEPFFLAMAAHLESHGVPDGGATAASLRSLGLHVLDAAGAPRQVKDLFIVEELVTFAVQP